MKFGERRYFSGWVEQKRLSGARCKTLSASVSNVKTFQTLTLPTLSYALSKEIVFQALLEVKKYDLRSLVCLSHFVH